MPKCEMQGHITIPRPEFDTKTGTGTLAYLYTKKTQLLFFLFSFFNGLVVFKLVTSGREESLFLAQNTAPRAMAIVEWVTCV